MSEHQKNSNTPPQQDPLAKAYSSLGKTTTNLLKKLSAKIGRKVVTKFVLTMGKVISVVLAKTAIIWAPILALFIVGVMGYMLIYGLPRMVADEAQGKIEDATEGMSSFFGFSEDDEEAYDGDDIFEDYLDAANTWDEGLDEEQRRQAFPYRISWGVLAGTDRMRNDPHIKDSGMGGTIMHIGDHNITVDGLFPPRQFIPIYKEAAEEYHVDWEVLAAIHEIESTYSTYPNGEVSSAGARGPMQFLPCTWYSWSYHNCNATNGAGPIPNSILFDPILIEKNGGYGVDATGDGYANILNEVDAIHAAANYLNDLGYSIRRNNRKNPLAQYGNSSIYAEQVLANAEIIRQMDRAHEETEEEELEDYDLEEIGLNDFDFFDLENWDHLITPDPYGIMEILRPEFEWETDIVVHTWEEEVCTEESCIWVKKSREEEKEKLIHAHTFEGTYTHHYERKTTPIPGRGKFGRGNVRNYQITENVTTHVTPPSEEDYLAPFYEDLELFGITKQLDIDLVFELIELFDKNYLNQQSDLAGLYTGDYPDIEGSNDWLWPTVSTRITSRFGPRSCTGCSTMHRGVDIGGTTPGVDGDPIFAMEDGNVEIATYHSAAGNYIRIGHGNGIQTRYLHLENMYVRSGQTVEKGDVIGTMGNTGSSRGTHLHFEIIIDDVKKDPLHYFPSID